PTIHRFLRLSTPRSASMFWATRRSSASLKVSTGSRVQSGWATLDAFYTQTYPTTVSCAGPMRSDHFSPSVELREWTHSRSAGAPDQLRTRHSPRDPNRMGRLTYRDCRYLSW